MKLHEFIKSAQMFFDIKVVSGKTEDGKCFVLLENVQSEFNNRELHQAIGFGETTFYANKDLADNISEQSLVFFGQKVLPKIPTVTHL